jgi:hypothetical protein
MGYTVPAEAYRLVSLLCITLCAINDRRASGHLADSKRHTALRICL